MYSPMPNSRTSKFPPHTALRKFRRTLGLSQSDFGRAATVHEVYVSQIETGAARMGLLTAQKIIDRWPRELIASGLGLSALLGEQRAALNHDGEPDEQATSEAANAPPSRVGGEES